MNTVVSGSGKNSHLNRCALTFALLSYLSSGPLLAYDPVAAGETQAWYEDAKFGIFIHWGIYSVPAYAPVDNYPDVDRSLLEELWVAILVFLIKLVHYDF